MNINNNDQEFQEMIEYYRNNASGGSQEALVAMLREIQELYGYIDREKQEAAANALGISSSVLTKIIKLYPSLKSRPTAHRIVVCTGKSCSSHGASQILDAVYKAVEKRKPGTFEIVTRNCLKACVSSPNLTVDGQLFSGVCKEEIDGILDKFGPLS